MKQKLEAGQYKNANKFYEDLNQIYLNCLDFNPTGPVREAGIKFKALVDEKWVGLPPLRMYDSDDSGEESDDLSDIEREKGKHSLSLGFSFGKLIGDLSQSSALWKSRSPRSISPSSPFVHLKRTSASGRRGRRRTGRLHAVRLRKLTTRLSKPLRRLGRRPSPRPRLRRRLPNRSTSLARKL